MTKESLLYNVSGNAAYLTINREKTRNALNPATIDLFHQYLNSIEKEESIKAVVITGAGEKVFCAGADLSGVMFAEDKKKKEIFDNYALLLKRISLFQKPTIAKVGGHCLAGGLGIMLACDIAIAKEEAQFATPEIYVGLFPMMICALIFKNVPFKKAMEMILTGEKFDALKAEHIGLITSFVPSEKLDEKVAQIVSRLSEASPYAIKCGKEAISAIENMTFEESLYFLSEKLIEVSKSDDAKEGITAFMEKRKPVFGEKK